MHETMLKQNWFQHARDCLLQLDRLVHLWTGPIAIKTIGSDTKVQGKSKTLLTYMGSCWQSAEQKYLIFYTAQQACSFNLHRF